MNSPLARPPANPDFRARFAKAEFLEMVEAGAFGDIKIELVNGELERMHPPFSAHSFAQTEVAFELRALLGRDAGLFVYAELGIDLGDDTVRVADVVVAHVLPSARRLLRPDELVLIAEIADDTLARDLGPKRLDYAGAGIAVYWVVDVSARAVTVMTEPVEGDYLRRDIVRFGEPLAVPGTDLTITL